MTEIDTSRRERKKDETRQRIFREAVRLFREKGFEATTIDDITERADVGKGTFFNYFPRKESVLAYLLEKQLLEAESSAAEIANSARPVRDRLIDVYLLAAGPYEADRDLSRYVIGELMSRGFAPAQEAGRRWHEVIVRLVQVGQSNGEFRSGVDPLRAESVLTSVYYGTLYMWANMGPECDPHPDFRLTDELRECLALALSGLAAPGGEG